jgi:hypothetical protein
VKNKAGVGICPMRLQKGAERWALSRLLHSEHRFSEGELFPEKRYIFAVEIGRGLEK